MFVEFDQFDPAPQSLYKRQNKGALKEPAVIGFAYSRGLPNDYTGNYFATAFTSCLNQIESLPTAIIVYRSGANEGEFRQVKEEANEICAAAKNMKYECGIKKNHEQRKKLPTKNHCNCCAEEKITPVSLPRDRDHNLNASQANSPSGTSVDCSIVSPCFKEFIMTSQKPNIGTSLPVRYTNVVEDGLEKFVPETEHMTHFLCHGHQR
ncbi:hypothetical protein KIN20_037544 [Parelaphostrongylus tenuis]|uniref:Piwi domain-containing protein n=1 Tax=Parelaphostrongylus tenuis TaxID=148309 RepID=A0AAD5WL87_PARTN|nr:hypothetical protein KIN20_037544 [Parelaphostrongylus tenuis]